MALRVRITSTNARAAPMSSSPANRLFRVCASSTPASKLVAMRSVCTKAIDEARFIARRAFQAIAARAAAAASEYPLATKVPERVSKSSLEAFRSRPHSFPVYTRTSDATSRQAATIPPSIMRRSFGPSLLRPRGAWSALRTITTSGLMDFAWPLTAVATFPTCVAHSESSPVTANCSTTLTVDSSSPLFPSSSTRRTVDFHLLTLTTIPNTLTRSLCKPWHMSSAAPSPIGSVIADRYEVLERLGSGQHGEVWRVHDRNLGTNCALKLLGSNQIAGPWAEARLLSSLSGDYILPIRNADTTPDGTRYLVTDVAENGTVMDRIDPAFGVVEEQAVSWVREACNGLARVHRHGLLHRDVKPENLFLTDSAKCLVGDLSLAGLQNASGCVAAGGTLETMAPEVGAVDLPEYTGDVEVYCVRSEVFSLGATLYWLLAGTPPVTGARFSDAATTSPVDLWELAAHVSRGTRDIVMKALGRDPATRHPDPAALAAALGRRNRPDRQWARVAAHPDHDRCYEGVKAGKTVDLCVIQMSGSSGHILHARHRLSGRRLAQDGMSATGSGLNRAIRSAIRAIG